MGNWRDTLHFIGKKWVLETLLEFNNRKKLHFNELKEKIGITSSVLSIILKELEKQDLIIKSIIMNSPPIVEYTLSEHGKNLIKAVTPLLEFIYGINPFLEEDHGKFFVTKSIENAILEIGHPELSLIKIRLKKQFGYEISDCYKNPQYLKIVLKNLYGDAYLEILNSISKRLGKFSNSYNIKLLAEEMK